MRVIGTSIRDVMILEPRVFEDARGYFMETYQKKRYKDAGVNVDFVQDNLSCSRQNTLRGLHFQHPHGQAKLVQVLQGEVYDVAVDVRMGSPTFGKWCAARLSAENKRQMFIPAGFAHGVCVLSDTTILHYKCSDYFIPACENGVFWRDAELGIEWPVREAIVSEKDAAYPCLADIAPGRLPVFEAWDGQAAGIMEESEGITQCS
jgi:dTDP-4-dehydrorhamnose 3,5-epimerase